MVNVEKLVVFGSTGQTGLCVLKAALQEGYTVTAFVRDPKKVPEEFKGKLNVIVGDCLKQEDIDKAMHGQDAVVVALGTRGGLDPTTELSESLKNILESMKKFNVSYISTCISSFLFWERAKLPERYIALTEEHERMQKIMEGCDRKWIVVNPPHIADEPSTDGKYLVEIGKAPGRKVSKYDLGEFLVKCLTKPEYFGKITGVSGPA